MSLEKLISFLAHCDFCSNVIDTDEYEWQNAIDNMKKEGWKVYKEKNDWLHKCDACCGKEAEDDF